jgi:hypothetical protein
MASMIVTFPTVWAHLIGQLLYYMGDDHIVFGSDSLWYGGPQWQIDALWRFQIPDQIQDKWKYPSFDYGAKQYPRPEQRAALRLVWLRDTAGRHPRQPVQTRQFGGL